MVVKWNTTDRKLVRAAIKSLAMVGARFTGILLNQVDQKKAQGYGYGYSGYSRSYDPYYGSD